MTITPDQYMTQDAIYNNHMTAKRKAKSLQHQLDDTIRNLNRIHDLAYENNDVIEEILERLDALEIALRKI